MYNPSEQANQGVIRNRQTWLGRHGLEMGDTTRVHVSYDGDDFCRYRIVDESHQGEGMTESSTKRADALVTAKVGHVLFLPIADCVATTLFDVKQGVLMLSHLGRHSLEQQGGVRSVQFLVDRFGSDPKDIKVWLSPAPRKEVYPIFKLDNKGMKEATFEQLQAAGILHENITDNTADTATSDDYYSHSEFLKGNKPDDGRFAMAAVMVA